MVILPYLFVFDLWVSAYFSRNSVCMTELRSGSFESNWNDPGRSSGQKVEFRGTLTSMSILIGLFLCAEVSDCIVWSLLSSLSAWVSWVRVEMGGGVRAIEHIRYRCAGAEAGTHGATVN